MNIRREAIAFSIGLAAGIAGTLAVPHVYARIANKQVSVSLEQKVLLSNGLALEEWRVLHQDQLKGKNGTAYLINLGYRQCIIVDEQNGKPYSLVAEKYAGRLPWNGRVPWDDVLAGTAPEQDKNYRLTYTFDGVEYKLWELPKTK